MFGLLWNICVLGGLSDEFTRADPNLWNWSRPFYCGLYGIYRLLMLSVLFKYLFFAWVGYIISAAHVAGPKVFTLALEKAREEETEKEDGQLPELHGQDAPGRWRRGLRQHGAHDEELHAQDRELPHLRTMEP